MPATLETRGIRVSFGRKRVIADLTLRIAEGRVTALVGPNGSGKSTVLRALARLVRPDAGAVVLDGRDIAAVPTREVGRRLALLPQSPETPAAVTVRELVGYGRYPHRRLLARRTKEDDDAVQWALDVTGVAELADRSVDTLSGGERQRAWIAMTLAQRTGLLLLDEPTTFLDIRYQLEVLSLVRRLNREHGITVVWVLHDLNHAAAFSDRVVMLREGAVHAEGAPADVMTPDAIRDVFGVDVSVLHDPVSGAPTCIPIGVAGSEGRGPGPHPPHGGSVAEAEPTLQVTPLRGTT